jgi:hypothetical protein
VYRFFLAGLATMLMAPCRTLRSAMLLGDIGPGLVETWEIFSAPGNQFDERPR